MIRKDYEVLRLSCCVVNNTFNNIYASFNPYEDFKADLSLFNSDNEKCIGMEVKSISTSYGSIKNNDYWSTKSARGSKWRWCSSASTEEEFWNDETPAPDLGDKPIQLLNATDKNGNRENAKLTKLLKDGCGLIYVAEDGLLLFSPKRLKEAIVGYGWVYLEHTKRLGDKSKRFEQKALIDMSKGYFIPVNNVPKELLN